MLSLIKSAWKFTFAGLCMTLLFASLSHADQGPSKNVKTLKYIANNDTPLYFAIWRQALLDIFKGDVHDPSNSFQDPPYLFYAEYDLDDDGTKEIITYIVENSEEVGVYCYLDTTICPHFILKREGNEYRIMDKIFANSIDVGEEVRDGYHVLKVFKQEDDEELYPQHFSFYYTYRFDPKTNKYIDAVEMPKKSQADKAKE